MPEVLSASTTAPLSSSGRPRNRSRLGGVLNVIQISAAAATSAIRPSAGRLFATAGWAAKVRAWLSAVARIGGALGRVATLERVGVAVISVIWLISDRHAPEALGGGQEPVSRLQRRLESDRGLLARKHHCGDVGDLAFFVGLAHRRALRLHRVDLAERVAEGVAEAGGRRALRVGDAGNATGAGVARGALQSTVLLEDGGAHLHQTAAVDGGHWLCSPGGPLCGEPVTKGAFADAELLGGADAVAAGRGEHVLD